MKAIHSNITPALRNFLGKQPIISFPRLLQVPTLIHLQWSTVFGWIPGQKSTHGHLFSNWLTISYQVCKTRYPWLADAGNHLCSLLAALSKQTASCPR